MDYRRTGFWMISVLPRRHLQKVGFSRDLSWTAVPCESKNPAEVLEQLLEDTRPASTIEQIVTAIARR